jgi:glycosyltransferase involved in cell wall biosynthesis
MAAGIPVICSNTTSLPEVGGDAVLYVNPEKDEELSLKQCSQISNDDNLRKPWSKKETVKANQV